MWFIPRSIGYCHDTGGYSGAFSWWRSTTKPSGWSVCDHTGFCDHGVSFAVIDDFGNLVRVKD